MNWIIISCVVILAVFSITGIIAAIDKTSEHIDGSWRWGVRDDSDAVKNEEEDGE